MSLYSAESCAKKMSFPIPVPLHSKSQRGNPISKLPSVPELPSSFRKFLWNSKEKRLLPLHEIFGKCPPWPPNYRWSSAGNCFSLCLFWTLHPQYAAVCWYLPVYGSDRNDVTAMSATCISLLPVYYYKSLHCSQRCLLTRVIEWTATRQDKTHRGPQT